MPPELAPQLSRELEQLAGQVVVGRAIHPDGMPSLRRSAQLLMIALAVAACAKAKKEPVPEGDILATLLAPTLEGAAFQPDALRGKPSFVMFVSPTCPHCLDQLPVANKVAKAQDANAVAVFVVGKAENARGVIEHTKFDGFALIDDGSLKQRYGIRSVPYTLVLGADGYAKAAFRGAQTEGALTDAIASAR
jgi:thiol-disulfide isomerase/thioredoxin